MNLSVSDDGDLELDPTTNNLKICTGVEEIRQIILRNLETIRGEWFLDTSLGVPWFTDILRKDVTLTKIDNIIIEEIVRSAGVISLLTYQSDFDAAARSLSISFSAETVSGILDFNQTIA